jgi:hypothetical protein
MSLPTSGSKSKPSKKPTGGYSSIPKIEAVCSSETSDATQQTTRRHIPEDDTLVELLFDYDYEKHLFGSITKFKENYIPHASSYLHLIVFLWRPKT